MRIGRNCVEYEVPEEVSRGWALRLVSLLISLKFMKQMQPQGQDIEILVHTHKPEFKALEKEFGFCFVFVSDFFVCLFFGGWFQAWFVFVS